MGLEFEGHHQGQLGDLRDPLGGARLDCLVYGTLSRSRRQECLGYELVATSKV